MLCLNICFTRMFQKLGSTILLCEKKITIFWDHFLVILFMQAWSAKWYFKCCMLKVYSCVFRRNLLNPTCTWSRQWKGPPWPWTRRSSKRNCPKPGRLVSHIYKLWLYKIVGPYETFTIILPRKSEYYKV